MWPFFPLLRTLTGFTRIVRAVFGPMWFAWTSFAILYTALLIVVTLAWLPFRRRFRFFEFVRWPSRVFLALTVIGSIAGCYQALVPLRVERVPVTIAGLRALDPDVVVIAGDLIDDDPHFVPKLLAGTRALDPRTPLLAVLGNHEMYGDPRRVIAGLRNSRIRLLVNEGVRVGPIWFGGISDYAWQSPGLQPNIDQAFAHRGPSDLRVLLAHQPRSFPQAISRNVPLTLVAHTHGGQCGIRPLGWSLAGVFLPYHMGLYRRGASQLYVNTGTGYWLVPFRLGMTPEITLIELRVHTQR
jgi:predicted MPP superfamily phosphohydrolase